MNGDEGFPDNAMGTMLNELLVLLAGGFELTSSIEAYHAFVRRHEQLLTVPEPVKCDAKAAELRQEGNRLYQARRFQKALAKYNESLCYAEAGSEQLAMGYGNRSAIYVEQGEYEFALLNIGLAKANNCPEKLLEKLKEREQNCRKKLDEGEGKDNVPCPRMGINVEVNSKIPFLAKGIGMKLFPGSGRGLVAEKDFKAGDIFLDEKPIISVAAWDYKFLNCSRCAIPNQHSLIPCPGCVSYMYCSEECCVEDKRLSHRFECGLGAQAENIAFNCSNLGPKLFFYGLTLFNDDLDQMMNYCEETVETGSDPFTLDYTQYDRLQEFKVLHEAKLPCNPLVEFSFKLCAAANHIVLLRNPSLQALITTEPQKRFFLNCLYHYHRVASYFAWESNTPVDAIVVGLMSIGTVINHSCDPNATVLFDSGRIKGVLIRPVRKGEQIASSLGPAWFALGGKQATDLSFKCRCNVCRYGHVLEWLKTGRSLPPNASNDLSLCLELMATPNVNLADQLNALQQIIQRYAQYLPNMDMSFHVRLYIAKLEEAIKKENVRLNRVNIAAAVV